MTKHTGKNVDDIDPTSWTKIGDITPLIGRRIAIGYTFHDKNGQETEVEHYWGCIQGINDEGWVVVQLEGKNRVEGDVLSIPPDFAPADSAAYELPSTGEVVQVDFVCSWDRYPSDVDPEIIKGLGGNPQSI